MKHSDALKAIDDNEFMRSCNSKKLKKLIREAVKEKILVRIGVRRHGLAGRAAS